MKDSFQNLFKDLPKATELYNANPIFFNNFGFQSLSQLTGAANANQLISHPILNFVK